MLPMLPSAIVPSAALLIVRITLRVMHPAVAYSTGGLE
jgi:hypothetical protein